MTARSPQLPQVYAKSRAELRAWLAKNHASSPAIALVLYKKGSGKPCVTYDEAVEEGLCFGWIDSRANTLDAERYTLMFSPRKPKSGWSKTNKVRIERLIAEGRMTPAGLEKIEAAKRDGSWTALDAIENLEPPPGLIRALSRNAKARRHFDAMRPSPRKLLIRWVATAKRPETVRQRIDEIVAAAAQGRMPEAFERQMPAKKRKT